MNSNGAQEIHVLDTEHPPPIIQNFGLAFPK